MQITKNIIDNNNYELVIKNNNSEEFKICYGGADLYWLMLNYVESNEFIVTKEDGLFYNQIKRIFKLIGNNKFEWLSEAYGLEEEAHKLIIEKIDDNYSIRFIRNPLNFSPINTCFISFCLSGSRNQVIATAFSSMFLEYKYEEKAKVLTKKIL